MRFFKHLAIGGIWQISAETKNMLAHVSGGYLVVE